ncbi:DUF2249 domain-containing protein [Azospirillum sp.]|uniref:DUF2249 domain-containing protein n=1 Tax=Azospirillum sp. TaxID=34012 RepID=UPI002D3C6A26|nr:DUF2249 domain-containing protein [Azospirillum sp.]HYD64188.1 DUF2249 domain-containing protein [Azospirillum sp.]
MPSTTDLSAESLLSDALRADPAAAGRITAALGADNALSRLLSAHRLPALIRLDDAATIAGTPVERLIALVRGAAPAPTPAPTPGAAPAHDWFAQAEENCGARLDVRPLLTQGQDPFATVMHASTQVPPGAFFILDAPFDPAPLRRVLAGKGFMSVGRELAPGHWRICLKREGGSTDTAAPAAVVRMPGETWREGNALHIEVRGLAPPGPMTAVIRLIEQGEPGPIVVHHDRDPMLLYPELEERAWECVDKHTDGGEVRLTLRPQV